MMKVVEAQTIPWLLNLQTMDSHCQISALSKVKQTIHFISDMVSCKNAYICEGKHKTA